MRTRSLLDRVLPSPLRERGDDTARMAPAVMQVRLKPGIISRASCCIAWTRGTLRRSQGSFRTTLGRPPHRVRGIVQVCLIHVREQKS